MTRPFDRGFFPVSAVNAFMRLQQAANGTARACLPTSHSTNALHKLAADGLQNTKSLAVMSATLRKRISIELVALPSAVT